jgi:RNA polymerase sigma-70 factor (ECF subfamily)
MDAPRTDASEWTESLLAEVDWVRALARSLIDRADLADDAAQEAILAALRRPPAIRESLRQWLARVTRNAVQKTGRAEGRRRVREASVARTDEVASTLEVVERFSVQHSVAGAVLALDEPYRDTLLLRFYEDLTLREIAERSGVAVTTVQWRLERGIERLRASLDREHGEDRRAWVLALLPFAEHPGARLGSTTIVGSLTVARLAWSLAFTLLAVLGFRAALPTPPVAVPVTPSIAAPAAVAGLERPSTEPVEPTGSRSSSPELTAPDSIAQLSVHGTGPGSLTVELRDANDAPVAGVPVLVWPDDPRADVDVPPVRATGPGGRVSFADLASGAYRVRVELGVGAAVDVRAGEEARAVLRLLPGPVLAGRVIDERGAPVAGAGVWASSAGASGYLGGRPFSRFIADGFVALTNENGEFRLPTARGIALVGARKVGRAPSAVHHTAHRAADPAPLELVLAGVGGAVRGVVSAPEGRPVEGALVFLDAMADGAENGSEREEARAPLVFARTDSNGAFHFAGVRPGVREIDVRAPELATWSSTVEVPVGGVTQLEVELSIGMSVVGTVRDESGEPVSGARVHGSRRRWYGLPDLRHATSVRTRSDGSFELRGLVPGACWLTVDGGARGVWTRDLYGDEGSAIHCDVQLTPGLELRGRVVDESGVALAGCTVRSAARDDWNWRSAQTDGEGRFAFTNCEERTHALRVEERGAVVVRREATPGADEMRIVVPAGARASAALSGVLVDHAGAPAEARGLWLVDRATGKRSSVTAEDLGQGAFRASGVVPGTYSVEVVPAVQAPFTLEGTLTLGRGEQLDLGLIAIAPSGRLQLDFARKDGGVLRHLRVDVLDTDARVVRSWHLPDAEVFLPVALVVPVGSYSIRAFAETAAPLRADVLVEPGASRERTFALEAGAPKVFAVRAPTGATLGLVRLVIRDGSGRVLLEQSFGLGREGSGQGLSAAVRLSPGEYTYDAESSAGLRASGAFAVAADVAPGVTECTLRRSPSNVPKERTRTAR